MVKKTNHPTFDGASKGDDSKSKKAGNSNYAGANRDKPAKAVKPAIAEYFAAATEKASRKKAADNFSAEFKAKHSSKRKPELIEREARAEQRRKAQARVAQLEAQHGCVGHGTAPAQGQRSDD